MYSLCQAETYTFGVIPQKKASVLAPKWKLIFNKMSKITGHKFVFATRKNIPQYKAAVENGEFDFIYDNPYHYLKAHTLAGYEAIAHAKNKKIKGLIVVKKDSLIQNVTHLKGKDLYFPRGAFAADVLPRAMLEQKNIVANMFFTTSHEDGYYHVSITPDGVAAGGVFRTLKGSKYKDDLRVLWESKGYTPHAVAAHPKIPDNIRQGVIKALIDSTEEFKKLKIKEGMVAADDSHYDDLREIEPFLDKIK